MTFGELLCRRIQNMGRAEERLNSLLGEEVFYGLGKHNEFWDSSDEAIADKLDGLRMQIMCVRDNLWDIMGILKAEEEDEY